MQRIFNKHMSLQRGRRRILQHFWKAESQNEMGNGKPKDSPEWVKQNIYIDKIAAIPDEVRDAVIEKWLTYAKSENLTEF